jgi:hypothetical protein
MTGACKRPVYPHEKLYFKYTGNFYLSFILRRITPHRFYTRIGSTFSALARADDQMQLQRIN